MSEFDIILDSSQQNLRDVPPKILRMRNLKMLYLQQNFIKELPKNFFPNLPHLSWLDLRNNHLASIPTSIAHHQHLENLLLSDNKIEALPNELGLVPTLKVLQVANNPLVYPNARIVTEGTKAITSYLRHQYEKIIRPPSVTKVELPSEEEKEMRIEKEIRVVADYINDMFPMQESMDSSLTVKGLSQKVKREDSGIIHKMANPYPNKILLKSYYDEDDKLTKNSPQTNNTYKYVPNPVKHSWLEKLKQLLDEQERILQQERNLQALTSWRYQKKNEPPKYVKEEKYRKNPPYATDMDYETILSKQDMQKEIDRMIQKNQSRPKKENIDKLINELVGQLKEMEGAYSKQEMPKSEIEAAESQIRKIMEMHKKLIQLQEANNLILQ